MSKKEVEITQKQLEDVIGKNWSSYSKILDNCYCRCDKENPITTIIDYKIFAIDAYDIVLKGKCKKCGNRVNRVTETGDNPEYVRRIKDIISKSKT